MSNSSLDDIARRSLLMITLLAAIGVAMPGSSSTPVAQAKGPVKFTFCGKRACVAKSSPRFTAAMLYGGSSHGGPICRVRVHAVTAVMPGSEPNRRYLILASRGLIGERLDEGQIWWRKVKGSRKEDLTRAVRGTGRGFKASPEIRIGMFSLERSEFRHWRLGNDGSWPGQLTCSSGFLLW